MAIAFAFLASLGACASSPVNPTAGNAATEITGGLVVVRLERVFEPPASILLDVGYQDGKPETAQFAGKLKRSLPGRYADYLVALSLPPDRYLLMGLRGSGNSAIGDFALNVPFTVSQGNPDYLGRLVLTADAAASQARVRVEDHSEEDTVLFRTTLSKLKDLLIKSALIQMSPEVWQSGMSAGNSNSGPQSADNSTSATDKKRVAFAALTPSAASLLVSSDRSAFARFLRLKSPRAFATNHAGARGMASGPTAAKMALNQCNGQARANVCQLFAVDEMLLNANTADAPAAPAPALVPGPTAAPNRPTPTAATVGPPKASASPLPSATPPQTLVNPGLEQLLRAGTKK